MSATQFPIFAFAANGPVFGDESFDNVDWEYRIEDGEVTIVGFDSWVAEPAGSLSIPAVLNGYPVTSIGDYAFDGCSGLESVTIPSSVTSIGVLAFQDCRSLAAVYFRGNAPYSRYPYLLSFSIYKGAHESLVSYVREGTSGWGEVPGVWMGRPVEMWVVDESSLIPDLGDDAGEAEIVDALAESADWNVVENFLSVCEAEGEDAGVELYREYRDWAGTVKNTNDEPAGFQAVCDSPTAWASFALDSATLLERNPTDEDLKVEEFKPAAESGKFDFTVSVADVEVGARAAETTLKRMFGLEGATELVPSAFAEANVGITFDQPVNGMLKFTAEPRDKSAKAFFMKMKVR